MNQSLSAAFVNQNIDVDLEPFPTTFLDLQQNGDLSDVCQSDNLKV
jgi:hypothetical protein